MKKLNRRKFLKKISSASIGSLIVPPIFLRSSNRGVVSAPPTEFKPLPESWRDDEITMAWIGHSTVLMNFYGVKIYLIPFCLKG